MRLRTGSGKPFSAQPHTTKSFVVCTPLGWRIVDSECYPSRGGCAIVGVARCAPSPEEEPILQGLRVLLLLLLLLLLLSLLLLVLLLLLLLLVLLLLLLIHFY